MTTGALASGDCRQSGAPNPLAGLHTALADAFREVTTRHACLPETAGLDTELDVACAQGDRERADAAIRAWKQHHLAADRREAEPNGTASIWIASTPPSLNRIAGRGSRHAFIRVKRRWQTDLATLLMAERLPRGLARVEASAVLTFPIGRRRDAVNHRTLLDKALGDALVEGRWLADDTPEYFDFGSITFAKGSPRTTLTLRYWTATAGETSS